MSVFYRPPNKITLNWPRLARRLLGVALLLLVLQPALATSFWQVQTTSPDTAYAAAQEVQTLPPAEKIRFADEPSAVALWNEVALAAVRNSGARPTVTARSLFLLHLAMYDAWAIYDDTAHPVVTQFEARRPAAERTEANKTAAVSQAAYHMLMQLYPDYALDTNAYLQMMGVLGQEALPFSATPDLATPAGIGLYAAQQVTLARADDGANADNDYADVTSGIYPTLYKPVNSADPATGRTPGGANFDPNRWQPLRVPTGKLTDENGQPIYSDDPSTYIEQKFLTPQWGAVEPFALSAGDQFRPPPPPMAGSDAPYTDGLGQTTTNDEAYRQQVDALIQISADLSDYEKVLAEFWADGPRTESPPGHWNQLAQDVAYRDDHGLDEDVKMFFALNGALFDTSIAVWEAKRHYDFVRPQSAIRHRYFGQTVVAWGGPNQGAQQIPGELWRPYQALTFVTPPFAEYVSGHSSFSFASADVLTRFTGSPQFYDDTIVLPHDLDRDGVPDRVGQFVAVVGSTGFEVGPTEIVALRWPTFQDAAREAALSRRYGGIHIQDGDLRGREVGQQVGELAYATAEAYWTGERGLVLDAPVKEKTAKLFLPLLGR